MIKYITKIRQVEVNEPHSIICDVCKRSFRYGECDDDHDLIEIQEFVQVSFVGGYGSVFGDGSTVELDLCQACLKKRLGAFVRVDGLVQEETMNDYGGMNDMEARAALRFIQYALAAYRDGETIFFEGKEVCLEEVKYLVVDPVLERIEDRCDQEV